MLKIKTVLCPTDFSPPAERGTQLAIQICRRFGSRLVFHHNLTTWIVSEALPETLLYLEQQQDIGAETRLRKLVDSVPESVPADYRITTGQTHASILDLAKSLKADLIVMGTHGRGGLNHLLIGSITERILHQATVPVLTTRSVGSYDLFARGEPGTVQPETQVVVPVDFSTHSLDTLEYAFRLAENLAVVIHLLHVVEPISWDDMRGYSHFNVPEFQRRRMMEASERLNGLIPDSSEVCAEAHVRMGTVVEEIIGYSDMIQADLILMGIKPKGGIRDAIFGATSYGVLRGSRSPVWVVPGVLEKEWVSAEETRYSRSSPVTKGK